MPAMMEMSVVFPHPEGPTSMASSPMPISRFRPRSACTLASPAPNHFVIPSQNTACCMLLPSKDHRRLKNQHLADAQQTGDCHDEQDDAKGADHRLPKHEEAPGGIAARHHEKRSCQSHPDGVTDGSN